MASGQAAFDKPFATQGHLDADRLVRLSESKYHQGYETTSSQ